MAATRENIVEEFQEFDIDLENDEIISKLVEISELFAFDADSMVNEWLAYQSRHNQTPLTITELEQLEHELVNTRSKSTAKTKTDHHSSNTTDAFTNISTPTDALDIMAGYCSPGNRNKLRKMNVQTPVAITPNSKFTRMDVQFSPLFSPPSSVSKGSQKYSSRINSGEVTAQLYEGDSPNTEFWLKMTENRCAVRLNSASSKPQKYMFQKIMDVSDVLNDNVESIAEEIQQAHKNQIETYAPCSAPCQSEVVVVGQMRSESNTRLLPQGVVLVGDRVNSFGRSVPVDLERLSDYSLYPGQVMAMLGTNPTGSKFIVSRIFTPTCKSGRIEVGNPKDLADDDDRLTIIAASGPFTTSDSLSYEPLLDLISVVKQNRPDVTIIIGPLVDSKCNLIENGLIDQAFGSLGQNWINFICNALDGYTQTVFVPSHRDLFHHPVYPQPPYVSRKRENVHFATNPSTFKVGDVNVGVTSADILFHLGAEEISLSQTSSSVDRLSRLTGHLLTQKSFYPLYPPHESMPFDVLAAEQGCQLPNDVDVLLLPSDLKTFVKCLNGRVVVNPGRLAKGLSGGTYTRLVIAGTSKMRVGAEIVKI
ncbi:DNA polymerase alpha subunit B-like [Clavelina lepadiformis]|uniref:DNA polymerase alpha subunit B-like n=1 Tax=Clavelina lepadiformis TaxID=159417 RepID=UPI0040423613